MPAKSSVKPESAAVCEMFSSIANRYDCANRLLSLGIDVYWRNLLARQLVRVEPKLVADLACGSGDLSLAIAKALGREARVIGGDFCGPMLRIAQKKSRDAEMSISFVTADCLNLPFDSGSIDAVSIAFGFRNFENRNQGLKEIKRCLRPGGHLFILEFTQPYAWVRPFYYAYLRYVLPLVASKVTGNVSAYKYLSGTIEAFPSTGEISQMLESVGFELVEAKRHTFGIVAIHHAKIRE